MKRILNLLFLIGMLTSFPLTLWATKNSWDMDKTMKLQLGYVPDKTLLTETNSSMTATPSLELKPAYLPDITNIHLNNFLKLGFPVDSPLHPEQYRFYLKLFHFPASLDIAQTTNRLLQLFYLDYLNEADRLKAYLADPKNTSVKLGWTGKSTTVFSQEHPCPQLLINSKDPNRQRSFNQNIPFFSLYIKNTAEEPMLSNNDEKAEWTTQAVSAFQAELLNIYQQKLTLTEGNDPHFYYFVDRLNVTYPNQITVIKMAKQPLIFKNWRELPMPQDEQSIFVTSLLLTYRTVYTLKNPMTRIEQIPKIDSPTFNELYKTLRTQVFELSTILYLE